MANRRKLTAHQVREIRAWWAARTALPTVTEMSRRHGVALKTLRKVGHGHTYKRIEGALTC